MNLPELDYIGFVEGDGIAKGAPRDHDGRFQPTSAQAAEGTARQMSEFLRSAMASSWRSRIGLSVRPERFCGAPPQARPQQNSNGGMLLGLKGAWWSKSHGEPTPKALAYAVDVGYEMVRCDLLTKINHMLNRDGSALGSAQTGAGGCLVTAKRSSCSAVAPILPRKVLTNAELAARLDTSDGGSCKRTGIRQRHIAAEGEFTRIWRSTPRVPRSTRPAFDAETID